MLAQVFECPHCGDVWRGVEMVEDIDCDRDSVEIRAVCSCGRDVREKCIEHDGNHLPVMHGLTDEEMEVEMYDWSDYE